MSQSKSILVAAAVLIIGGGATYLVMHQSASSQSPVDSSAVISVAPRVAHKDPNLADKVTSAQSSKELNDLTDQLELIARQRRVIGADEAMQLVSYIKKPRPAHISADDWQYLMNGVLNAVRESTNPDDTNEVAATLVYLASSSDDITIRLYALQHISFWFEKDKANRQMLIDTLVIESKKPQETAGTATLVLADLEQKGLLDVSLVGIDADYITTTSAAILVNQKATNDVRRSAIAAMVERRQKSALPSLREVAANTKEQLHLRKAAVAAIRDLGTKADIPLLQALHKEGPRMRFATTPAIKQLSELPN